MRDKRDIDKKFGKAHDEPSKYDMVVKKCINNLIFAAISAILITILMVFLLHYFIWKIPLNETYETKAGKLSSKSFHPPSISQSPY